MMRMASGDRGVAAAIRGDATSAAFGSSLSSVLFPGAPLNRFCFNGVCSL